MFLNRNAIGVVWNTKRRDSKNLRNKLDIWWLRWTLVRRTIRERKEETRNFQGRIGLATSDAE